MFPFIGQPGAFKPGYKLETEQHHDYLENMCNTTCWKRQSRKRHQHHERDGEAFVLKNRIKTRQCFWLFALQPRFQLITELWRLLTLHLLHCFIIAERRLRGGLCNRVKYSRFNKPVEAALWLARVIGPWCFIG